MSIVSRDWQHMAREWYKLGDKERGDDCQIIAWYWGLPVWCRMLPWNLRTMMRAVERLEKKRHE